MYLLLVKLSKIFVDNIAKKKNNFALLLAKQRRHIKPGVKTLPFSQCLSRLLTIFYTFP